MNRVKSTLLALVALAGAAFATDADAGHYIVTAQSGPSFSSPEEAVVILETMIFPMFEALVALEKEGKIMGGLPVGDRALSFVLEASDNAAADRALRDLPAWGMFEWNVVALESFAGRYGQEKTHVKTIKTASR